LELTWPHKNGRLLYEYDKNGNPHPTFEEVLCTPEPRALVDVLQVGSEKGREWDDASNLLIRGDNLTALETLKRYYAGKIKLIYIDPPFNTGQAFEEYDDGLEHSIWLTMMRDRLELLRELLAEDGSLWCEIDDTQVGYLNVLLDEIFGRSNRIATVTVKRSAATGHKAINPGPINVTDFIFGYARLRSKWVYNPQLVTRGDYDKQYNKFIRNIDKDHSKWKLENLAEVAAADKGFASAAEARKVMSSPTFNRAMIDYALANANNVVRLAIPNYVAVSNAARALIDKSKSDDGIYLLERSAHSNMYFIKGQRILFLRDKIQEGESGEAPSLAEKLTNFWDDIAWQGIAKEGGVDFKKNKKPERLLQRIIALGSRKGDLVLDSFAGSGTTGAVAHKMGRRWILVEIGDQSELLALTRMKRVVSGKDTSGVSRAEGFAGGGGFRYMTLAEPLISHEPTFFLPILNPKYSNGLLITAICLREGFTPTGDAVLHGRGGDRAFAHVTEDFVTGDYLEQLSRSAPIDSVVTVYCLNHDSDVQMPEHLRLRRIPGELASQYCGEPPQPRSTRR
jgi:adenine-specific DNA-methyltransferase